jgi:dipeptidyl aminopeptidase/acylaminoacyl peptidase
MVSRVSTRVWSAGVAAVLAVFAGLWLAQPEPGLAPTGTAETPPALPAAVAGAGRAALIWHDGLWLSDADGRFDRAGGLPRGAARDPAWRGDGPSVAVAVHTGPSRVAPGAEPAAPPDSDLWLVDADGAARPLVRHEAEGELLERPAWHPDGRTVYFERSVYTSDGGLAGWSTRVERGAVDTGERALVVDDAGWPAVSPDGRWLAFSRTTGGLAELWLLDLWSGQARRLETPRFAAIASPRFLPDAQTIVFAGAPRPSSFGRPRAAGPSLGPLASVLGPRPAYAHGPGYGLWLVGVDGSAARQVGAFELDDPSVRWPNDGAGALVVDARGLHRAGSDEGRLATVLPFAGAAGFDWLPRR